MESSAACDNSSQNNADRLLQVSAAACTTRYGMAPYLNGDGSGEKEALASA